MERFNGDLEGDAGFKAFKLGWGRRVRGAGVGLGGGLGRVVVEAPRRDVERAGVFVGERGVVREDGGCGIRDMTE